MTEVNGKRGDVVGQKKITRRAIAKLGKITFRALTISSGMTVCVSREPAVGTSELQRMLYLAPSSASELDSPTRPIFAKRRNTIDSWN